MKIEIPGWETLDLCHLVLDFNGTIAFDGKLLDGVAERLEQLSRELTVHIVTADTFGSCADQCRSIPCQVHVLDSAQPGGPVKDKFVEKLGAGQVAAIGNGANDMAMLEKAALGIAVMGGEGLCISALYNADLVVMDILHALDLLIHPQRLVASLRR